MNYLRMLNAKSKTADMYVYGPIGGSFWDDSGITSIQVAEALAELEADTLRVHIDSPGGDAQQGFAIYTLLSEHPVQVETIVDGWAASAASIVMQAGDTRSVSEVGLVMIHEASAYAVDNKRGMRKLADILEKLDGNIALTYARRAGDDKRQAEFASLMEAETWSNGTEAVALGLADSVMRAKAPEDSAVCALKTAAVAMRPKFAAQYKKAPQHEETEREIMRIRLAIARSL